MSRCTLYRAISRLDCSLRQTPLILSSTRFLSTHSSDQQRQLLQHFFQENPKLKEISRFQWHQIIKQTRLSKQEITNIFKQWKMKQLQGKLTPEKKEQITQWMHYRDLNTTNTEKQTSGSDSPPTTVQELAQQLELSPYQVSNYIYELRHNRGKVTEEAREALYQYLKQYEWNLTPKGSPDLKEKHLAFRTLEKETNLGRRVLRKLMNQMDEERMPLSGELQNRVFQLTDHWMHTKDPDVRGSTHAKRNYMLIQHIQHKTGLSYMQVKRVLRRKRKKDRPFSRGNKGPLVRWIQENQRIPTHTEMQRLQMDTGLSAQSIRAMIRYALSPKGVITQQKRTLIETWLIEHDYFSGSQPSKEEFASIQAQTKLHIKQIRNIMYGMLPSNKRTTTLTEQVRKRMFSLLENGASKSTLHTEGRSMGLTRKQISYLNNKYQEVNRRVSEVTRENRSAIQSLLDQNQGMLSEDQIRSLLQTCCSNLTRQQVQSTAHQLLLSKKRKQITAEARLKVYSWRHEILSQNPNRENPVKPTPQEMEELVSSVGLSSAQIRSLLRRV